MPSDVVLIPLKGFSVAKERLAGRLEPDQRADLARRMADIVREAAGPLPVVVVTDDSEVAAWADRHGARMIFRPARGLDDAVQHAVATLATEGVERVIVAHGDLPLARDLHLLASAELDDPQTVALVPDRHGDGTNVLSVPATAGFRFAYGPGSSPRHRAEADRLGLPVWVVTDTGLSWDIDHPADLDEIGAFLIAEY